MAEKLRPFAKKTIWAGGKLGSGIGELYLFSVLEQSPSLLESGGFLADAVCGEVPLIKYIDAEKALSVQVHPNGECGKDELWIVDDVYDDAAVFIGFQRSVCKKEFCEKIKDGTVLSLLRKVTVFPGDLLWIPGGTIHAAQGISFFEIQHSRDITYRLYDYGRGRDTQWEEGFSVLNFTPSFLKCSSLFSLALDDFWKDNPFSVYPLFLHGAYCQRVSRDLAVIVRKGTGKLNEIPFRKGDCFFCKKRRISIFFR